MESTKKTSQSTAPVGSSPEQSRPSVVAQGESVFHLSWKQAIIPALFLLTLGVTMSLPFSRQEVGCLRAINWPSSLITTQVINQATIAIAYIWMPITLVGILRARRYDIPRSWALILICFAAFIVFCGIGHIVEIWTIWNPYYWIAAENDAATGLISLGTAALLQFRLKPILLKMTTYASLQAERDVARAIQEELEKVNGELEKARAEAMEAKKRAEAAESEARGEAQKKEEENAELRRAYEQISEQRKVISELSAPMLRVRSGVIVCPLIGSMDSVRASDLQQAMAATVGQEKPYGIILDISEVSVVDTAVAQCLINIHSIVRLMGTMCVITGIRPAVAQTIVALGVDLNMRTTGSVEDGLELIESHRRR